MLRQLRIRALLVLLAAAAPSRAAAERTPLGENFSRLELVGIGSVALLDVGLIVFQRPLIEARGAPAIGAPSDLDRSISEALYRGPGSGRFLAGVPDVGGMIVAPALALAFYGGDALAYGVRGRSLTGDGHADHEFFALVEGFGAAYLITQVAKLAIGRERPRYALGRDPPDPDDDEATLSFFSGHATASFCLAAFVTRDVGDWLATGPLADRSSGVRLWVGRIAPGVLLYGAAGLVGASRIVDQKHYFTDVLLGALVGTLAGNLSYALHFDSAGEPRGGDGARAQSVPIPGGLGFAGTF